MHGKYPQDVAGHQSDSAWLIVCMYALTCAKKMLPRMGLISDFKYHLIYERYLFSFSLSLNGELPHLLSAQPFESFPLLVSPQLAETYLNI